MEEAKKHAGGRPSTYNPDYPAKLREHMKGGNSFESFGALVHCSKKTLWNWASAHEEFLQAKKIGETYLCKYYEDMGRMIATGGLKRLVSEEPSFDMDGKVVYDKDGNIVMKRTWAPAVTNSTAWIFLCKNMLGWRDRRELGLDIAGGQLPAGMSKEQAEQRLTEVLLKVGDAIRGRTKDVNSLHDGRAADRSALVGPSNIVEES